jgi:DNA-directed RNA polymerase II subunit RPB2
MLTDNNLFKIIKEYFDARTFVSHQLESYNHMITHSLQKIVEEESTVTVTIKQGVVYTVEFGQVHIDPPKMHEEDRTVRNYDPAEARLRNATYEGALSIDISTKLTVAGIIKECENISKYTIGHIPIMVQSCKCNLYGKSEAERIKSGECSEDPGGYFIIRGKERVLVTQERAAYNMIGVHRQKSQSKHAYIAEVRSMSDTTGHSVLIQAKIGKNFKDICFSLPYINTEIPAGVVFVALGFKIEDIPQLISAHEDCGEYISTIVEECGVTEQDEALEIIGRHAMHVIAQDKRAAYASQILENEIFPHMGVITHGLERTIFLATLIKKLIETTEGERRRKEEGANAVPHLRPPDDRDNVANKRFEVAGVLTASLFRSLFKRLVRSITPLVEKRPDVKIALDRFNTITQGFRSCFSTGKWGVQKNSYVRQGVSQVLSRLTFGATLSHLRRIVIPIGKEGKNTQIRQLHGSQIFFICLFETPEGHSSGIVKNFSLSCEVTNGVPASLVREIVENLPQLISIADISVLTECANTRVYINGNIIGITTDQEELCRVLRDLRDKKRIDTEVSVAYDDIDNEIHIATDGGRLIRPLFHLEDNKIPDIQGDESWQELIESGKIRYRDPAELENNVVAMCQENLSQPWNHNLCELHPSLMMGVCASIIPYQDHSQSPRNCYQSAMGKQALGIYALSNQVRSDTIVHMLDNAQQPLTTTRIATFMGFDNLPSGQNVMVAILAYTGFNQEDSIIISKSAIDRGLFRVTTYKTVVYLEKKKGQNYQEKIHCPSGALRKKFYNYSKLGEDGIVKVGQKVNKNDVLIGKTLKHHSKSGKTEEKDCSIVAKSNEAGIIDKVIIGTTPEGFKFVRVKIRLTRIPEVGDKFASRAAQKGTCGAVYSTEDLPFTMDGITPDLIINPHCIPSRMTINQLIESLGNILTTETGVRRDATSYSDSSTGIVEKIQEQLKIRGLNPNGLHRMRNGFTGEMMDAEIYMGPTYYQRLKHMVSDKMHARAHGDVQVLTRQPLEGRSREGGLRFGEMERDCMFSHGSTAFLKERLLEMSDYFEVDVCDHCHQLSTPKQCVFCGGDQISRIQFPYACKLLFHELQAMSLKINLLTA